MDQPKYCKPGIGGRAFLLRFVAHVYVSCFFLLTVFLSSRVSHVSGMGYEFVMRSPTILTTHLSVPLEGYEYSIKLAFVSRHRAGKQESRVAWGRDYFAGAVFVKARTVYRTRTYAKRFRRTTVRTIVQ